MQPSVGDVDEGDHGVRDDLVRYHPPHAAERGGVLVAPHLLLVLHAAPPCAFHVAPQLGGVEGRQAPERDARPRQVARQRQGQVERPQHERELERLQEPARHGRHRQERQVNNHHLPNRTLATS